MFLKSIALQIDSWCLDLLIIAAGILAFIYIYLTIAYRYWKKRGVPYLEPTMPFGSIGNALLLKQQIGVVFSEIYLRLKDHKVGGIYQMHRPALVVIDPDVIKSFLVKDFGKFQDRGLYFDEKNDPISAHLFNLNGQKWKNLRVKLSPTFTSGKMKMMFHTLLECGQELTDVIQSDATAGKTIEVKDLVARYSSDVIASCAFGIQCNCLRNPDAEFRKRGLEVLHPGIVTTFGFLLNALVPSIGSFVNLGNIPKGTSDFFRNMVRDTINTREKNDIKRNDLMQLMIQLKNKGYVEEEEDENEGGDSAKTKTDTLKKLTVDEIAAQAFVFFVAGFETSSTTVSFCLYELAVNPDIQTRMRSEIDKVLATHGGQLTYEAMQDMEYMDMVVAETLRKYPPLPQLNRECNAAFTLPDTEIVVEPGTPVVIPVYGLHHDPQYYPEPERFDPQRFTPEMKASRNNYTYLPFGEGPRICIGMRFAFMQTKVALISLLAKYEFHVSENTKVPITFDTKSFTLAPAGGVYLKVSNRT